MNTEARRQKMALRAQAFERVRREFPAQSIRWCRFQAARWADMELRRRRENKHIEAVEALQETV